MRLGWPAGHYQQLGCREGCREGWMNGWTDRRMVGQAPSAQGRVGAQGCGWVMDGCQARCPVTWGAALGVPHMSRAVSAPWWGGAANCSLADEARVVTVTCVRRAPALGCTHPPPPNVLAEMTDFMLIRIYPALITLWEVRSERLAFNTMSWQVPTPACPCLLLPARIGVGAAHTAAAQGTGRGTSQGGISPGTWHPCPSWGGGSQRCCLGTGGHPRVGNG